MAEHASRGGSLMQCQTTLRRYYTHFEVNIQQSLPHSNAATMHMQGDYRNTAYQQLGCGGSWGYGGQSKEGSARGWQGGSDCLSPLLCQLLTQLLRQLLLRLLPQLYCIGLGGMTPCQACKGPAMQASNHDATCQYRNTRYHIGKQT